MTDDPRPFLRRRRTWLIATPIIVVLAAVVGPFVYINFIQEDAPERLTLTDRATESDTGDSNGSDDGAVAGVDGTWTVGDGSIAGYRVKEVLFGQDADAAGRTSDIVGELTIDGTTIAATTFTVDMTTIRSNESRRDGQFHGRIMDTATHKTAVFELTEPVEIDDVPAEGTPMTVDVSGTFTIRGVTRPVTFELTAQRNGDAIEANGTIPVKFSDYEIPDASFGGVATVQDHGEIEFLLIFARR